MINKILILIALINLKFEGTSSASVKTKTVLALKTTTEGADAVIIPDEIPADVPISKKNTTAAMDSKTFDDIEFVLKDIFKLTTSAPNTKTTTDGFDYMEIKLNETGATVSLDWRTSFEGRPNCPCVVGKRCAKTTSCLKRKRSGKP